MLCASTARHSLAQRKHKSTSLLPVEVRLQCISAVAAVASARPWTTSTLSGRCRRRRLEQNISPATRLRASQHITRKSHTSTDSTADNIRDGTTITSTSTSDIPYTYNSPQPTSGTLQQSHHDLSSFLAHALRTKLSPSRTVYKGTFYEYVVAAALKRLGFKLVRTGGASDRGVDLVGWWRIPRPRNRNVGGYGATGDAFAPSSSSSSSSIPITRPIRVVIQCKALRKGPQPRDVRELESTVGNAAGFAFVGLELDDDDDVDDNGTRRHEDKEETIQLQKYLINNNDNNNDKYNDRIDPKDEAILGLLVSTGDATRGVREALSRSQWPLGFLKVSTDFERTDDITTSSTATVVEQFIWNHAASEKWLTGLGVTVKYSDSNPVQRAATRSSSSSSSFSLQSRKEEEEEEEEEDVLMTEDKSSLRRDIVLTWKGEMLPFCL